MEFERQKPVSEDYRSEWDRLWGSDIRVNNTQNPVPDYPDDLDEFFPVGICDRVHVESLPVALKMHK